MKETQQTLVERGLEVWCDSEHDVDFAKKLYPDFKKSYFRVKGVTGVYHLSGTDRRTRSPSSIIELVEYQHPDIMVSFNSDLFLSIEITCSNYWGTSALQRVPRSVRASELGVPNIILANRVPTSPIARIPKVSLRLMEIYNVPSLAIMYEEEKFDAKFELLRKITQHRIETVLTKSIEEARAFIQLDNQIIKDMKEFCNKFYREEFRKVEIHDDYIKVNIDLTGKRRYADTPSGWETKGTGLLDPYPGCVLAYDLLLCRTGPTLRDRKRKIYVHFRKLPRDFWWFERARKSGGYLYWNMIEKLTDGIIFKGETLRNLE